MLRAWGYARNGFLTALIYPLDLWGTVLSTLVMLLVQSSLWRAVYAAGSETLGGYALPQMLAYVLTGRVVAAFTAPEAAQLLGQRIRKGTIATDLARPVDLQAALFAQGLGTNLFKLLAVGLPAFGALAWLGLLPVPSVSRLGLFLFALAQGYLILFGLNFLLGLAIFRTGSHIGLYDIEEMVIRLFSGAFLPITLFPGWLQAVSRALPFESIYYLPLAVYTDSLGGAALGAALLRQSLWAIGLLLVGRLLWGRAVRRLAVQGG